MEKGETSRGSPGSPRLVRRTRRTPRPCLPHRSPREVRSEPPREPHGLLRVSRADFVIRPQSPRRPRPPRLAPALRRRVARCPPTATRFHSLPQPWPKHERSMSTWRASPNSQSLPSLSHPRRVLASEAARIVAVGRHDPLPLPALAVRRAPLRTRPVRVSIALFHLLACASPLRRVVGSKRTRVGGREGRDSESVAAPSGPIRAPRAHGTDRSRRAVLSSAVPAWQRAGFARSARWNSTLTFLPTCRLPRF